MKEITYKEWQKNPTPRMMWVWNSYIEDRIKLKVIYIIDRDDSSFPVIALNEAQTCAREYRHCAEIKEHKKRRITNQEPKTRRMSNQELSRWLLEKPTRRYKLYNFDSSFLFIYEKALADKEVADGILIRENGGEWHEPLVEVEE